MNKIVPALVASFAVAGSASAAFLEFAAAGGELASIELESGVVAPASSLVGGSLTAFSDTNTLLIAQPGSAAAPATRAAALSDLRLDTGFANTNTFTFTFDTAVQNAAGVDLLIFDFGNFDGNGNRDRFSLGLDGGLPLPFDGDSGFGSVAGANFNTPIFGSPNVSTVAALETADFTSLVTTQDRAIGVIGIDLDAFGIASGASISSLNFSAPAGQSFDPVLVLGVTPVPEPASAALLAAGLGLLASRRRRA